MVCILFSDKIVILLPNIILSVELKITFIFIEKLIVEKRSLSMNKNNEIYDDIYIVTDDEAIQTARDLAKKEGIMCGISSGTNVAAALKLAQKLGEGKTVVTVLPDTAERYFSTPLFEGE